MAKRLSKREKTLFLLTAQHQSGHVGGNPLSTADFPPSGLFYYITTETGDLITTESGENALVTEDSATT